MLTQSKQTQSLYPKIVFLLLYYIYLNPLRKIVIPFDNILIPGLLFFTFIYCILKKDKTNTQLTFKTKKISTIWIIIAFLNIINNANIPDQLLHGGLLQLIVMINFVICTTYDQSWLNTWITSTKWFAFIYAITTIVFYLSPTTYRLYIFHIHPEISDVLLKFYELGWMSGIASHFSTNGMVLATGLMIAFEIFKETEKNFKSLIMNNKMLLIILVLLLYALVLSSKRAPLIFSFTAILLTYLVTTKGNYLKKILIITAGIFFIYLTYELLEPVIPGLSTIVDKFHTTNNDDAGVLNGREYLWGIAFKLIEESPIIGNGRGCFAYYAQNIHAFTFSAHNYYLEILAEFGIIGLFFYLFVFLYALYMTIKTLRIMLNYSNVIPLIEIISIKSALNIQLFVIFYCLSASALSYYAVSVPYFLALSVSTILTIKYDNNTYENRNSYIHQHY